MLTKMPLTPVTEADIPPHFMADYCLRCGTMYADGQCTHVVKGGNDTIYRDIALDICGACLMPPNIDMPLLLTVYKRISDDPRRTGYWLRYLGNAPGITGYAKVSMLDNGLAFVGLHRGHVEHWTRKEVKAWGGVHGSYAEDYTMYLNRPGLYHSVIDVRFYDLATPIPPALGMTKAENRFIRVKKRPVPDVPRR